MTASAAPDVRTRPRLLPSLGVGALAGVLGLLPWLLTGLRLPLQNLWAADVLPEEMPLALLPFSQYFLTLIVSVIVTGSALAGLAARVRRGIGPLGAVLGVVGVQVIALVQSALTVSAGLRVDPDSDLYLAAIVGGTVGAIAVGALLVPAIARAPRAGAAVAISLAAVAAGGWLTGVVAPLSRDGSAAGLALLNGVQWLPGILAGLALAWCGVLSVGRVIAWIVSLAVLWVGPVLVTAVSAAAGSRVLARHPLEMLDYAQAVFTSALMLPAVSLRTPATALVVAALGVATLRAWHARKA
ncbi:hypothetical protein [Rathayibacter sp. VKM Ac-2760]|uniref:hypothetical protein n=1 Tax=Rathayibacter sp. VKM Ac-2760 TaxID=2609253 RepID=UPI00131702F9|nr:hypothetical protein [Rathayibacter sp. VKM Ac-2760]QHC60181.1 hypothetical protein GSU72_17715 [Rathayibacter sp. VKM Ac-2760]